MTNFIWVSMKRVWLWFLSRLESAVHPASRLLSAILFVVALLLGSQAQAALMVNSVTLDGGASTTVAPGASIVVFIAETNTGGSNWRSVRFRTTDSGNTTVTTCVNTPNHDGNGSHSETFSFTAPLAPDTYDVAVRVYEGDTCGGNSSSTINLNSGIVVVSGPGVPTVTTGAASSLAASGATLNGTVSSNGASTAVTFDYGLTTAYGSSANASASPLAASATNTAVSAAVTGLSCGKTYHFRVNGVNSYGTTNGSDRTFATSACVPTIIEFNSSGGTSATNGLHVYIEDSTKLQIRRLNNTGQVYSPTAVPTSASLDNGVFLRANGLLYGPSHNVGGFSPSGGNYDSLALTAASPANPSTAGMQQTATANVGVDAGPQLNISWKYTTPLEFVTAEVTLTIPAGYAVSASNPVRYYHAVDTYLGGSDQGCGVRYVDANGKQVVGTYPPASGTTCPSSTAVPTGVSIVESFRERSGLAFSHYCTNFWSNFWDTPTSGTACAISGAASLTDSVTTTYQDTGIAIEYDFTAPGTYTFSYDFVIGSTVVPAYDHIEIQHDGSGALCPDNITVLACTSSGVPCAPLNYVNSGTLTGTLTNSPATPAVVWSPSNAKFSIGSSSTTNVLTLTGVAPGGTYTLSATGMSSIPLNGTKCYNTSTGTTSCTFVVTNTACSSAAANFNVVDGYYADKSYNAAADHRIYTKSAGWNEAALVAGNTNINVDVVALKSDGTTETNYAGVGLNKDVKLELLDDSSGTACNSSPAACAACSKPIVATVTPVTFVVANAGYQNDVTVSLGNTKAYSRLIARVTDTNGSPAVVACSSDAFAVRPQAFAVTATTSGGAALLASTSGPTAPTTVKAGAAFTMYADAGAVGYSGTPAIDTAKVSDFLGLATVPFSGGFSTADSTTGKASGTTFTYGDVGYFVLAANAVYDAGFTSLAGDAANGDCVAGSFSNTKTNGKYGCGIGSAGTSWGRFIPDHFDTAVVLVAGVPMPCPTGLTCPALFNGSVYSGQPFAVTTTARNLSGGTTQNYSGGTGGTGYSKAVTLSAFAGLGSTTAPTGTSAGTLSGNALAASGFTNGVGTLPAVAYGFTTSPSPPTAIYLRAIEDAGGDAVSSLRATNPTTTSVEGGAMVLQGRIWIPNVYGSERLPLPMTATVQYFNGNFWTTSLTDSVTTFNTNLSTAGGNLVATVLKGPLTGVTVTSPGSAAVVAGVRTFTLAAPLAAGSVNLQLNAPVYLPNASARATFGIFRSPLIYRRENY